MSGSLKVAEPARKAMVEANVVGGRKSRHGSLQTRVEVDSTRPVVIQMCFT